ncbi:hypothetical protein Taro_045944 [Colocasia esculenta]|uniref:non-specific serine/threonine protein kinase n=1 Tax=Colocasia esculenta TaxID=4460 RepID=A0A843WQX3_COLES|nr:hypothetical protein [Colocasia esculenta]
MELQDPSMSSSSCTTEVLKVYSIGNVLHSRSGSRQTHMSSLIFALGFFGPEDSTADCRNAGTWYHRLPARMVVWVANRPRRSSHGNIFFCVWERENNRNITISMGLSFLSVFVIIFLSSAHQILSDDPRDRLAAGESISGNETIVSAGQIFALGFFTPENSSADHRRYVGIWYHRLPGRTVVWVANRENPLADPAGVLTVGGDGNIAVLDGAGGTVWSTNLSGVASNASAVLLDSGNLVLRQDGGIDVWQSFEHPTDTLLPRMQVRSRSSRGAGTGLTSWRGAADPSPGQFVLTVDPRTSLQQYVMQGPEIYARGTPWDGKPAITTPMGNLTFLIVGSIVKGDDNEISWSFYMVDTSMLARGVLDYKGAYTFSRWVQRTQEWVSMGSFPARACDLYNKCGPFGACVHNHSSCRCLDGFEPRSPEEWKMGNFTGGCVRRLQLRCDGTDRFVKVPGMKLPDGFSVMWNKSMQQCEAECSARCRCQGYAYADLTTLEGRPSGSRCLIWVAEMKDLGQVPVYAEDLYVRLHASELEGRTTRLEDGVLPKKSRSLIKIVMPIVSFGIFLMGICCYYFIKGRKSKVGKRKTRKMAVSRGLDFLTALGSEKEMPDLALLDFKTVKAITSNFSSENKLGQGGFGPVYKGGFLNGQEVAVKRLSKGSKQGYQEFHNELRLIARLQHNNLVRLLGWCTHKEEKILIYEYMPNGSLDMFIFDPTRSVQLNWEKRLGIIRGIANGLLYLHQHSRMRVIHRDLKTSNILLDSEMNPKISDFGLARIFQSNQDRGSTQKVVGTYGYMSPEYALNGVFSEKSDVFGFGVILLEIITGIRSTGFYPESNSHSLFGYAWQRWEEGRALELLDPSILSSSSWITEVLRCTQLAMLCIQEAAGDRPTMSSIVSFLSNDTSPLPMPKKPAFVAGRSPYPIQPSPRDGASKSSSNELTGSIVEGR